MAAGGGLFARPWDSQPQEAVGAADDVRIAYNAALGVDARGNALSLTGAPELVATRAGRAVRLDTTGKYVDITPRERAFAGSFCLLMAFRQSGAVNNGGTLVNMAGTAGSNNKIDIYTLSSGAVRADIFSSTGVATTADTAASAVATGGEYILALVNDLGAGTLSWWVNGQRSGASAATVSRSGESASVLFGGPGAGAAPNIDLAGVFVLPTAAGAQAHMRNPWQLFTPRRIWVPASALAGGGPATFYQATGGLLVPAGALRRLSKARRSGLITASATATKLNRDNKVTGSVTPSGTLTSRFVVRRAVAGVLTAAGVVRKKARKRLLGAITAAGVVRKRTRRALAGTLAVAGSVRKRVRRQVQSAITALGALATRSVTRKTILGSATLAGAVSRLLLPFVPSTPGDGSNKSSLMGTHRRR